VRKRSCKHIKACTFWGTGYECDVNNDDPSFMCEPCVSARARDKAKQLFVEVPKEDPRLEDPDHGF
jgi:hypothetical protein